MAMPTPGCRRFTMSRPSSSETIEAHTNQAIVLAPTRPTVAASPMWPMPTTSVENTRGPMIILISLRKMELIIDIYLATWAAVDGSGNE
jgi:hypothetical protein